MRPSQGELQEAKSHPNGWVYRLAGTFSQNERIPPEAIVGAWKVNEKGIIIGDFIPNAKYDARRWPS